MNRRELLGVVGAMGTGMSLASAVGPDVRAAHHGKMADNKRMAPLGNHHLHFCGIHCAKKDPRIQIITQHYCGPVSNDMHQCLLYDSVGQSARLLGVEYIISDKVYRQLPEVEKRYWHPHTYEVLSGLLIAPGMRADDEMAFMKGLLLTWGKTWHTWPDPTTPVPMGEPMLMWSATADGQVGAPVIAARDKQHGTRTGTIRRKRIEAIGYEVPVVPLPKDMEGIGRQWTATGQDRPTRRGREATRSGPAGPR
jgi:hypothetical protein